MELPISKRLKEKGIPFRLIEMKQAAISVKDVVALANGEVVLDEICKTVIIKGRKSGKLYGAFACGLDKLDFGKLKKILGEEMTMGDVADVKEAAGVEPGAVCPFLLSVPLLVDNKILAMKRVNCGSGDHFFGLEFCPEDLQKDTEYMARDLVK